MERFSGHFREKYPHMDHLDNIENLHSLVRLRREYIYFPDVFPELRDSGKVPANVSSVAIAISASQGKPITIFAPRKLTDETMCGLRALDRCHRTMRAVRTRLVRDMRQPFHSRMSLSRFLSQVA